MKEGPKKNTNEKDGDKISKDIEEASEAVTALIRSIAMTIEEKVALEDQVRNISREAEYMLDRIDDITKENQKKLLLAYKKLLEQNLDAVNYRLKKLG